MSSNKVRLDISKSVRFDSRTLATVGDYLVKKCGYEIKTSTDLIRTCVEKFAVMITRTGEHEVGTYVEAREWFISHGLGDLFKQGGQQNRAHIRATAEEAEMLTLLEGSGQDSGDVLITDEMLEILGGTDRVVRETPHREIEAESTKADIDAIKNFNFEEGGIDGKDE